MVKHLSNALKTAFKKWRIEALEKEIQACTHARARLKARALKAQQKLAELTQQ
jgi:hypothetical protein